ncbi:hypothetical protein CHCC20335_1084 [Bacillus paralicheniformis]|nr:hypothetical protein CHCC20335_1084 [Bacillus paralicheniformis]
MYKIDKILSKNLYIKPDFQNLFFTACKALLQKEPNVLFDHQINLRSIDRIII